MFCFTSKELHLPLFYVVFHTPSQSTPVPNHSHQDDLFIINQGAISFNAKKLNLCDVLNMFKKKNVLSKPPQPLVASISKCLTLKQAYSVFSKPDETDKDKQYVLYCLVAIEYITKKISKLSHYVLFRLFLTLLKQGTNRVTIYSSAAHYWLLLAHSVL